VVVGSLLGLVTLGGLRMAIPLEDPSPDTSQFNMPRMPNYTIPVDASDMKTYLTADRNSAAWKNAVLRLSHWQGDMPAPTHDDAEALTRLEELAAMRKIRANEEPRFIKYYVGSKEDKRALGGNYQHDGDYPENFPDVIDKYGPTTELFATLVDPSDPTSACILYVVNRGTQQAEFRAADSSLMITRQAMLDDGTWADIDEYPTGYCGNSFHRVFLPPKKCWRIIVTSYATGPQRKVRYTMKTAGGLLGSNEVTMRVPDSVFVQPITPAQTSLATAGEDAEDSPNF
jgi:hypothetical protein